VLLRSFPLTTKSAYCKFGSNGPWQDATFVDIDGINVFERTGKVLNGNI
jgi:hypothetical protein